MWSSNRTQSTAKQTLSDWVYDRLLDDLIAWRLQPGDIVAEARLAETLGTSRTPVRESLRLLSEEGFLRVIHRKGYIVVPVTAADVYEVSYMRLLLEPEAAALVAGNMTPEADDVLLAAAGELRANLDGHDGPLSPRQVYDNNTRFHLSIARASGNRRLARAVERLLKEESRVMYHDQTVKDPEYVVKEHLSLLETVRSGQPDLARRAMRKHIEGNRDRLMASLTSSDPPSPIGIGPGF
jgi:DNA-binding GntR family transcriptional regulator